MTFFIYFSLQTIQFEFKHCPYRPYRPILYKFYCLTLNLRKANKFQAVACFSCSSSLVYLSHSTSCLDKLKGGLTSSLSINHKYFFIYTQGCIQGPPLYTSPPFYLLCPLEEVNTMIEGRFSHQAKLLRTPLECQKKIKPPLGKSCIRPCIHCIH